jgi:hypothetical protein
MLFPKVDQKCFGRFSGLKQTIAIGKQNALEVVSPLAHTSGVDIKREWEYITKVWAYGFNRRIQKIVGYKTIHFTSKIWTSC